MTLFSKVTIVGVGLIGGSLALSGRERDLFGEIVGLGRNAANLQRAKDLKVVDRWTTDLSQGIKGADLVVVATPVRTVVPLIKEIFPHCKQGTITTDVGSVKSEIVTQVEELSFSRAFFVGAHPIAGGEHSGVEAALPHLFEGRKCILTPTDRTNASALEKITVLWESVGSQVMVMDSERHDRILGAVSHLPHMLAYALVNYLSELEHSAGAVFQYAAGGLKDFTRIASSHPVMWADIAVMNRANLLQLLDGYQKSCEDLKSLIAKGDWNQLVGEFEKANRIRGEFIARDPQLR